jgi:hypothetical protein
MRDEMRGGEIRVTAPARSDLRVALRESWASGTNAEPQGVESQ